MSQPSAASQALSIPEILQHVLLLVLQDVKPPNGLEDADPTTTQHNAALLLCVLRWTAISSQWKSCILQDCHAIRLQLFHLPDTPRNRSWERRRGVLASQAIARRFETQHMPILNPVAQALFAECPFRFWRSGLEAIGPRYRAYIIIKRSYLAKTEAHRIGTAGCGANICDMLLAQPPIYELIARIWDRNDRAAGETIREPRISHPEGVTLGLTIRRAQQILSEHENVISIKLTTI